MAGGKYRKALYISCFIIEATLCIVSYRVYHQLKYVNEEYPIRYDPVGVINGTIPTGNHTIEGEHAKQMTEIKWKILRSKWIQFFPELQNLVAEIGEIPVPKLKMTNANYTTVTIKKGKPLQHGGVLQAQIIANDGEGNQKQYGGDFFLAALRPVGNSHDGILCDIVDNSDGTYVVECILVFTGDVKLEVIMVNPSESVYEMMTKYSSTKEYGVKMKAKMSRNSKGVHEFTECSVDFPDKRPKELCDFTNPTHGEKYTCLKPLSGECKPLFLQQMEPDVDKLQFWDNHYFIKGVNYIVPIKGSGMKITGVSSPDALNHTFGKLERSEWWKDPMEPSGWFWKSNWVSRKVKTEEYSTERIIKCLKNKDLHFIGDSTIRQWYFHFRDKLQLKDQTMPIKGEGWSRPRDTFSKEHNITMHFRPPGPPFHNNGDIWDFMSNVIDGVKSGGTGTVVLIATGIHFELFTPDVFLDRITRIKKALEELLRRLPGSKVIIKDLHYHDPRPPFVISPWKTRVLENILRDTFQGTNMLFFETWDFMFLARNVGVHPSDDVMEKSMSLLLYFLC